MKAKYFPDTDTLLVSFSDHRIVETRDVNEDVLVELDRNGRVVSMTVEHATQQTNVREFSYEVAEEQDQPVLHAAVREKRAAYRHAKR